MGLPAFLARLAHHTETAPPSHNIDFYNRELATLHTELEKHMSILDELKDLPAIATRLAAAAGPILAKVEAVEAELPDEIKSAITDLHDLATKLETALNAGSAAAPAAAPAEAAPTGTLSMEVQPGEAAPEAPPTA